MVPLTLTTPDTTSPVQLLKKLKGKESLNLIVMFSACACTDIGCARLASRRDTTMKRSIGNLVVLPWQRGRVRALFLSVGIAVVLDMTCSPYDKVRWVVTITGQ